MQNLDGFAFRSEAATASGALRVDNLRTTRPYVRQHQFREVAGQGQQYKLDDLLMEYALLDRQSDF